MVDEAPETLAPIAQLLVGGEALSVATCGAPRGAADDAARQRLRADGEHHLHVLLCDSAGVARGPDVDPDRAADREHAGLCAGRAAGTGADRRPRGAVHRRRWPGARLPAPAGADAERFLAAPLLGEARLYKTGDRARYRPDGHVEFLGRVDHQVKIRGVRIELEEIQTVLEGHPQVQQAAVTAEADERPAGQRLVAYVVAVPREEPSRDELRAFLRHQLPRAHGPVVGSSNLPALPLTPNGKLDRSSLPVPDFTTRQTRAAWVAPRTDLEQTLADIFGEVLQARPIGAEDNFFDLGMLIPPLTTKVLARVEPEVRQTNRAAAIL